MSRARLAIAISLGTVLLTTSATAQQDSGGVFQALINVDVPAGNIGSFACGGSSGVASPGGADLSAILGLLPSGGIDQGVAISQRRALYRLCDSQSVGMQNGWTGESASPSGTPLSSSAVRAQSEALAPEELFAGIDGANASYDLQAANVARRLNVLRLARRGGPDEARVALATRPRRAPLGPLEASSSHGAVGGSDAVLMALQDGIQGGSAEDDGLGFFLNGRVIAIEGDQSAEERGSDSVGGGFTVGVDGRLGDAGYAGGAFGYTRVDTSYDRSGSEASLDAYTFSLYGAVYPTDQMYVDLSVTGSYLAYASENEIIIFDSGPPIDAIEGDTDGGSIGADLGVGFDIPIESLTLSPYVRLSVVHTILDGFQLTGGDGTLDLDLEDQKNTSLTHDLGVQLGYTMSTKVAVVTPYVRASHVHEYLDENDDIKGSLEAISGADFKLDPTKTDEDYAKFGVGVGATFGNGFSQFVDYDVIALHENVTVHQVTFGLRLEF